MEDLSKDRLMRLQVEQLEKEKKDLNERLRIAAKRIDHVERAYRKDERPLLAQDYAEQQALDRTTFEALQKARVENSRAVHTQAVAAKKRLGRMQDEYRVHRERLLVARSDEYQRRKAAAEKKMEEEKEKRRQVHVTEIEAERKKREEAEAAARKKEEERLQAEAGAFSLCVYSVGVTDGVGADVDRPTCGRGSRGGTEARRRREACGAASGARARAPDDPRGGAQKGPTRTRSGGTCKVARAAAQGGDPGAAQHGRGCVARADSSKWWWWWWCSTGALREPGAIACRYDGSAQDRNCRGGRRMACTRGRKRARESRC